MPRQSWETNKAGGKGPAVARESDKWLLQPGCPVHPHIGTGPQTALIHAGPQPGSLQRCPPLLPMLPTVAPTLPLAAVAERCPISAEVWTGAVSSEHQLCPPCAWCQAAPGCAGRARASCTGGASTGRPAWQADGWQLRFNSASLFSQTNPVGFS